MPDLKGVCVGAGYFSQFHFDAWSRLPGVQIAAVCDLDMAKAVRAKDVFGIPHAYRDFRRMLRREKPDFVDIITPPKTHLEICRAVVEEGVPAAICQKPLAPTLGEAREIVRTFETSASRFMVHENWRFNPWYRQIKHLMEAGDVGDRIFALTFLTRLGDGWGERAYLDRQPYFRDYPRLLVYETGVHFIDTFRYLAGEVERVGAVLRRLNPLIRGEDFCVIVFEFCSGAVGIWNANRYNEPNYDNPRYTFGEMLVEAEGGSIRLYPDGRLTMQLLGGTEAEITYVLPNRGFSGDCVYATQKHFVDGLESGRPFETSGREYLKTLAVQEAVYEASATQHFVRIGEPEPE
jgi:predicted dehydrogenase